MFCLAMQITSRPVAVGCAFHTGVGGGHIKVLRSKEDWALQGQGPWEKAFDGQLCYFPPPQKYVSYPTKMSKCLHFFPINSLKCGEVTKLYFS